MFRKLGRGIKSFGRGVGRAAKGIGKFMGRGLMGMMNHMHPMNQLMIKMMKMKMMMEMMKSMMPMVEDHGHSGGCGGGCSYARVPSWDSFDNYMQKRFGDEAYHRFSSLQNGYGDDYYYDDNLIGLDDYMDDWNAYYNDLSSDYGGQYMDQYGYYYDRLYDEDPLFARSGSQHRSHRRTPSHFSVCILAPFILTLFH